MPTSNRLHLKISSTMKNRQAVGKLKEGIHSCAVRSPQTKVSSLLQPQAAEALPSVDVEKIPAFRAIG